MPTDIQIIPAILATTEEEYRDKITKISAALKSPDQRVQIDIMDGKFVPNKSVGLDVIRKYPTMLQKEAHLMVEEPSKWVEDLVNLGFDRIVIHAEVDPEEAREAFSITNSFHKVSILAFNPETPIEQYKYFEPLVRGVLIMAVASGFSGQEFIPSSLDKVERAKDFVVPGTFIEVDGGIDENSAKLLCEAGADYLVIGSHLTDGNITENLEKIRGSLRD